MIIRLGVVAYDFDPTTWEAETGRRLWVQGQSGLYYEFWESQAYKNENLFQ